MKHATSDVKVALVLPDGPPPTVHVGDRVRLKIGAVAEDHRSLAGVYIAADLGSTELGRAPLKPLEGRAEEAAPAGAAVAVLEFDGPEQPGEYLVRIRLAGPMTGPPNLDAAPLDVPVNMEPATVQLAVWGLPQPMIAGSIVTLSVGARSSVGANLSGATVLIEDDKGRQCGTGILGPSPKEGTEALYWCRLSLGTLPPGCYEFRGFFLPESTGLPHSPAMTELHLKVDAPPDRMIEIVLSDHETGDPLPDAGIRAGAFRTVTDSEGRARLGVAGTQSRLTVWKTGYEPLAVEVEDTPDGVIKLSAVPEPDEDPLERWRM